MKRKTFLAAILLASSMFFSVPPSAQAKGDCVDGVICPVPWDPYNCAPMGILVDCSVCTIYPQAP